jgi:hypothetical protein
MLGNQTRLVNTDECQGTAESEPQLFPLKTATTALGSDPNIQYVVDWLRKSDGLIQSSPTNSVHAPSRLIDLGAENGLRIVDTSSLLCAMDEQQNGFAALSYVWGTDQHFVLLNKNREALMSSFSVQQLPPTIRDAVTVTHRIGLRYLWVDALYVFPNLRNTKLLKAVLGASFRTRTKTKHKNYPK